MNRLLRFAWFILLSYSALGQQIPRLNLPKLNPERTSAIEELDPPAKRMSPLRSHLLIQYPAAPRTEQLRDLRGRGITILSYIPEDGFAVSVPDGTVLKDAGLRWYGRLGAGEKLAPEMESLAADRPGYFVVEFYSDVDWSDARSLATLTDLLLRASGPPAESPAVVRNAGAAGEACRMG